VNKINLKKHNISLTIAIVVTIVTAILFSFLFLYLGINHRKDVYNDSKKLAIEISRKAAFETQVYILSAIFTAKSLEQKAHLLKKLNGSRDEIRTMLNEAINENTNYLGVWTLWEPNAFDGNDHLYQNDSLYNEMGTIGIGIFRYNDSVYYEVMTTKDYIGDYYKYPKELLSDYLTEPYRFAYSGHKQLFFGSTVSVPIIVNDQFVGAIGVDIDLESLQNYLNKIKPYETGYLSLISNSGKIISHVDTSFIDKNIFDYLVKSDTISYDAVVNGKELTFEIVSEFTGEKVFRMFYPIVVAEGNKPWSMMIEIPIEKATYRSKQLLNVAIVTLIVGLSLLIYLIINISERKRYERRLLAAKSQAEESDRLKSAFLNNISHEIRTPLNGILGFSELLVDDRIKVDEAKSYKKIISESGKQLLSIIANVIELSKIQSGKSKINIHKFSIEKALDGVIESFKTAAKEKELNIVISYSQSKPEHYFSTDEDKLKQVFNYLIDNAIKFTHSGQVEIGFKDQGNSFLFYVKDTGIGIKPNNVKNIFEFFNQGDVSTVRRYGGLGIGLSISKSLVDMLMGRMWLESEMGTGSTFYFELPLLKAK